MKKTLLASSIGAIFVLSTTTVRAEPNPPDEIQIVITAGRRAQTVDETLAPVTVITQREITQSQASSIPEVLTQTVGLTLTNAGGIGQESSLHVRGTNDTHVLVLVDGVKVGSATLGSTALQLLPLDQVERIEVVRGPRSSLYGSEAIGGVVQIFTKRGSGSKGFQPQVNLSYGSHHTRQADAQLAVGSGTGGWLNIGASTLRTDGINATLPFDKEPDLDGFSADSFSLRAGQRLANGSRFEWNALQATGDMEFDGSFQNRSDYKQQVLSTKWATPLGRQGELSVQIGQSRDELDSFKDQTFSSQFNTKRQHASLQTDWQWGQQNLTAGLDYQRDEVESDTVYTEDSRDNTGLFGVYQITAGANKMEASVRRDDNEQFGQKTTGGLALARELGQGLRASASYGTAFSAPTFNALYYPYGGNPDLKPETSRNLELGLAKQWTKGQTAVQVFQNHIDDLIEWRDTGNNVWRPLNVDKVRIQGLEWSAQQQMDDWRVQANATWQQPEIAEGVYEGKTLLYRPEKIGNVNIQRDWGRFGVGANLHAEGKRYADSGNTAALGGFATLDMHGHYQLNRDLRVGVKVANVLDKAYQTKPGYNQDGVNGMVSLEYQPK